MVHDGSCSIRDTILYSGMKNSMQYMQYTPVSYAGYTIQYAVFNTDPVHLVMVLLISSLVATLKRVRQQHSKTRTEHLVLVKIIGLFLMAGDF